VNDRPRHDDPDAIEAALELASVRQETRVARAMLLQLQQAVEQAMKDVDGNPASRLRAANQQLICSALQALTDADDCNKILGEVARAAEHDPLTELPNRVLFRDRLEQAIAHAHRHGTRLAVLFVDLNRLKQINDTLGHAIGDQVLQQAAHTLAGCIRDTDTVSRHGGDEFLILLSEVMQATDAVAVADKITAVLGTPTRIGNNVLRLTASIGISLYPDDGQEADVLIDRADAAMYLAKRHGLARFVSHGALQAGKQPSPSLRQPPNETTMVVAVEPDQQATRLREANEQLVVAAMGAQELRVDAEQAQQRQTQFLTILAHELRSPLAPLRLAADLMERLPATELPKVHAIIEREVVHLSRLIGDLLDIARINSGKMHIERTRVNMAQIVDAAVNACRPAMDLRKQHFDVRLPSGPTNVQGDPIRLAQIVRNLLDNATKYTGDGGHIRLSLTVLDDRVVLTVSDDGIGINPASLRAIFDPYIQENDAGGYTGAGLGIGLAVVRELVEAHEGTVVALSEGRGTGSQFVVSLPLRR
jgi:diguanylate cyclase (GGDEF)-like protein